MRVLSNSERCFLLSALSQESEIQGVPVDDRNQDSDAHLLFEALHVLADGIPERLYVLLHPCGSTEHPEANPGKTMLVISSVSDQGASVFA